jgi:Zn-dependent protease/CBS domain-containing protein
MHGARIGRILGIELCVDWSWGFIFVLMTWNVTMAFIDWHPAWGFVGCVALAAVASLLFFASVLAHELAHALVALSLGIKVTSIRLFLFGGVSNLEHEPASAKAELLIAAVGPALSIGIGMTLLSLASLVTPVDRSDPMAIFAQANVVTTLLLWLGPANLIVGAFNLLPAFPLDGGRVLRALFWLASKNLTKATLRAAAIGQAIGWAFVLVGVAMFVGMRFPILGGGAVGGLWLAFIGWFLVSGASRSYASTRIDEALTGVIVGELMRRTGFVVSPSATIRTLVDGWFIRTSEHAFPVLDGDRLVGMVSPADIRKVAPEAWGMSIVGEIMTPRDRLVIAAPDEEVTSALRKLASADVEQLPVLEDGQLVGVLERRQITRWLELRMAPPPLKPSHA